MTLVIKIFQPGSLHIVEKLFLLTLFILWRKCCSGQSTTTLPPPTPPPPPPSDDGFFKKRDYENFDKISIISQDLSINEIHDE